MLVITRREGESIIINENIEVVVLRNRSGNIRLGVSAPREIPVRRQELTPHERPGSLQPSGSTAHNGGNSSTF